MSLRIRRGLDSQRLGIVFDTGELVWTTDTNRLYTGNSVTPGGTNINSTLAGVGLAFNSTTQVIDLAATTNLIAESTNLYFTVQRAQDASATLFTSATNSGISFVYDRVAHTLDATISSQTIQDDSASLFTTGTHSGVSFIYDSVAHTLDATISTLYIQNRSASLFTTGTHSGVSFIYDSVAHTLDATVALGGSLSSNLVLNSHNITGTGNINIAGSISTNSIYLTNNLTLNGYSRIIEYTHEIDPLSPSTAGIDINVSRGTFVTPSAVQSGDILSDYTVKGFDGANFSALASLYYQVTATPSAGNIPGLFGIVIGDYTVDPGSCKLYNFDYHGGFTMPISTTEPISPTTSTTYVADGVLWDPSAKASNLPYPVFFDGATFHSLY